MNILFNTHSTQGQAEKPATFESVTLVELIRLNRWWNEILQQM